VFQTSIHWVLPSFTQKTSETGFSSTDDPLEAEVPPEEAAPLPEAGCEALGGNSLAQEANNPTTKMSANKRDSFFIISHS
jgi:hypothetical protein